MPVQISIKKQFALGVLLLIVLLGVIEAFANIWLYNIYRCDFEDDEIFKNEDPETKRKICLENIGLNYFKEKLEMTKKEDRVVHINSDGYRGPEITQAKPENTYRIFTIGGSTTFGFPSNDNQTYPFYLQELYDQTNLGVQVEVINAGWPKFWSFSETEKIKTKHLDYEPNLFIVFDGWNDMSQERQRKFNIDFDWGNIKNEVSSIHWKDRWVEICDLGKIHNYDTIITLQPFVGTGKKILSNQEYELFIKPATKDFLDLYSSYIEQLNELKNNCSETADLTGIFDHVQEPIYYDRVHIGPKNL